MAEDALERDLAGESILVPSRNVSWREGPSGGSGNFEAIEFRQASLHAWVEVLFERLDRGMKMSIGIPDLEAVPHFFTFSPFRAAPLSPRQCLTSPFLPLSEIVQSNHVVADDFPLFVFRDAREIPCDNLLGMRPGGHRMWVVGRPHYVIHAHLMSILNSKRIVDKRGAHLPVEILTRLELQGSRVHMPIFPRGY